MGGQAYEAAGELLRALAAPVRIGIVTELAAGDRCVHELVDALGVAQPLVSQHLKVLRDAGLVRGRRRGREIAYALVDGRVADIVADAVGQARALRRSGDDAGVVAGTDTGIPGPDEGIARAARNGAVTPRGVPADRHGEVAADSCGGRGQVVRAGGGR